MQKLIEFFINPFCRIKVTLTMSSGKEIVFTCKKWNLKKDTNPLELTSLSSDGARGFPAFIKLRDVVCMQTKLIFSL